MDTRMENAKFLFIHNNYCALPEYKRNFSITIADGYIRIDRDGDVEEETNELMSNKAKEAILARFEEIKKVSEKTKTLQTLKYTGGDKMYFKIEGEQYTLTHDVSDEDVRTFYSSLKSQILSALNIS